MLHKKQITLIIFSFVLLQPLCAHQNPTPHSVNIQANPTLTTTISPTFYNTTTSTINIQIRDISLQIMEKAQETFTKGNYNIVKNAIKNLIWEYRYNLTAATIIGAYSTANIVLLNDYYYLTNTTRWSHWKPDASFELLCTMPQNELTQELIRAIGEQHVNKKNPTDLSHPLITFIETIEHEIKTCKRYLNLAKTIKQLHLMKIFPINDNKTTAVNTCLERALFIKHIFLSWLAERNLTTKSLSRMSSRWPS
jgi:hypothetical protein